MTLSQYSVRKTFIEFGECSEDAHVPRKRSLTWDGALNSEPSSECGDGESAETSFGSDTEELWSDEVSDNCSVAADMESSPRISAQDQQDPHDYTQHINIQSAQHGPVKQNGMPSLGMMIVVAQPYYYCMQPSFTDTMQYGCAIATCPNADGHDQTSSCSASDVVDPTSSTKKAMSGAQRRKLKKNARRSNGSAYNEQSWH